MKKIMALLAIFPLLLILNSGCGSGGYTTSNYNEPESTFPDLNFYGQWLNVPTLGYVWKPNAGYGWRPYSAGQWEYTDRGWMWFSDEPYGWIVYHYGYWAFTNAAGWVWIPGNDWSPARVSWIMQDNYIGWAPLPPAGWNLPAAYDNNGSNVWIIVRTRDFDNREIIKYRVPINNISNSRDWTFNHAPDPDNIRHATGRNITLVNIQTENVRSGKRDLTRVRVIDSNRQNGAIPRSGNDRNILVPPPAERAQPQQPATSNTGQNNGDRKANNPPQNVQPPKTRGNLVQPKPPVEKPAIRTNIPDRNGNGRTIEGKTRSGAPVIRKGDSARTKAPVIAAPKKPVKTNEIKKQKQNEPKLNPKADKKRIAKEKNSHNVDKRK